ncbi:hypothetical protein JYU34_007209 [Plutella xylostella]|uniref:Uncharacterized protein n=1 Tax=Plutella xylostella TaxID=51655 RepID=A0ABQ7QPW8_PLUXY|nr:hypothetical protein JYU34_007209 [Plutella xylostella]
MCTSNAHLVISNFEALPRRHHALCKRRRRRHAQVTVLIMFLDLYEAIDDDDIFVRPYRPLASWTRPNV